MKKSVISVNKQPTHVQVFTVFYTVYASVSKMMLHRSSSLNMQLIKSEHKMKIECIWLEVPFFIVG